jgi:hypothetical protein
VKREGAPMQPALVVTLTGAFVALPKPPVAAAAAPPVRAAPVPARVPVRVPMPAPKRPVVAIADAAAGSAAAAASALPVDAAASAPPSPASSSEAVAAASAPAVAPVAESPASAATGPASALAASEEIKFHGAEELTQGPVPQSNPAADQLAAARLVGRRLVLTLSIDADGIVRKAVVAPYEISAAQAALLQQAVAAVRFTPASIDGRPVAAEVQSRLCFDDSGLLDTSSPECWHFGPQPAR